jgi:hypothetical protein
VIRSEGPAAAAAASAAPGRERDDSRRARIRDGSAARARDGAKRGNSPARRQSAGFALKRTAQQPKQKGRGFADEEKRMPEAQFERELEIFRTEEEAGAQFFSAYLAVHNVAASSKSVYRLLNEAPLFWNTCLGALQTGAFIALGRVFDQKSPHNLDRLLGIAQKNPHIFSKKALGRRRQGANPNPPEWLDDFLRSVYEPTPEDFRKLRDYVKKWRTVYENNYRDIRRKVCAHKEVSDHEETHALFAKTNIGELQDLFSFLMSLYQSLWQLFFNGRKPDLCAPTGETVQDRITQEAKQFLLGVAGETQPDV